MRMRISTHPHPNMGRNLLFYDSHFINQMAAIAQLVDDEENIADIYCDTTLEVVVEVDVTTQ